jgi:AraC-like DNA-binding protein
MSEWILSQRLDRCRRDLIDPRLRNHPIHHIAAQWGFTSAAHFSRVFRAAYGLSPRDYRDRPRDEGGGNVARPVN